MKVSSIQFTQLPIDEVLGSLSKYSFDIDADLRPDVIKRDFGSILKVEKKDNKSRIVLDEQAYEQVCLVRRYNCLERYAFKIIDIK